MRRLAGAIPRGLKDHRTRAGVAYRRYVGAKVARLGFPPPDALPWLKESGLLVLALGQLHQETEVARAALSSAGRRRREQLRVVLRQNERRAARLRASLEAAERRIEELAARNGHGASPTLDEIRTRYAGPKGASA